jgi:hypothetical protein
LEKLAGKTDWSATGTGRGGSAYNHRVSGLVQRKVEGCAAFGASRSNAMFGVSISRTNGCQSAAKS